MDPGSASCEILEKTGSSTTRDTIDSALEHFQTYKSSGCEVRWQAPGILCKSGPRVRVEESKALEFARSINIPVPKVFDVRSVGTEAEISMEWIDGQRLEDIWSSLDTTQKRDIAIQLRHTITTMREARSEQDTIGAFGGPARDCRQISDYTGGPFANEADFNDFILDLLKGTPAFLRQSFGQRLHKNSRIVFSHGDLTPRNILVKDGHLQALLDWEYAGWYPEYWEFVKFFDRPTSCRDWKDYAEVIFDTTYPDHLLLFQALARWQKP